LDISKTKRFLEEIAKFKTVNKVDNDELDPLAQISRGLNEAIRRAAQCGRWQSNTDNTESWQSESGQTDEEVSAFIRRADSMFLSATLFDRGLESLANRIRSYLEYWGRKTALEVAVCCGRRWIVEKILRRNEAFDLRRLFWLACHHGHVEIARLLLSIESSTEDRVDVNYLYGAPTMSFVQKQRNKISPSRSMAVTPLMAAFRSLRPAVVEFLLELSDLDLNKREPLNGETALMMVCRKSLWGRTEKKEKFADATSDPRVPILELLLHDPRLDLNAVDDSTPAETALVKAVQAGSPRIVDILLQYNPETDARDFYLNSTRGVVSTRGALFQLALQYRGPQTADADRHAMLISLLEAGATLNFSLLEGGATLNESRSLRKMCSSAAGLPSQSDLWYNALRRAGWGVILAIEKTIEWGGRDWRLLTIDGFEAAWSPESEPLLTQALDMSSRRLGRNMTSVVELKGLWKRASTFKEGRLDRYVARHRIYLWILQLANEKVGLQPWTLSRLAEAEKVLQKVDSLWKQFVLDLAHHSQSNLIV